MSLLLKAARAGWLAAWFAGALAIKAGSPIWIQAEQATARSPLLIPSTSVSLIDTEALGPFLVPIITATEQAPGTDSWAAFRAELPAAGNYYLWARVRYPSGRPESFGIARQESGTSPAPMKLNRPSAGDARAWHWLGPLKLQLPAGPWTFQVTAHRAFATVYEPLHWRQAEPTFGPRLNLMCLADESVYVPTDREARQALGLGSAPPVVVPSIVPPPLRSPPGISGRKPGLPDWMRVPRWFTKDSWREELVSRHAGDISLLVRQVAANGGTALRLSVFWGGEAYYQSRVAPTAPGLGKLDYLREAVQERERTGVRIIVYINPNAIFAEHSLFQACAVRGPDGQISPRKAYGGDRQNAFYACINHPRYRQFLREVLTEIFTVYRPDGLYVDGLTPHLCFCEYCRARYEKSFHAEMPVEKLARIPAPWGVWGEFGRDPQPVGDTENDPDARRLTQMFSEILNEVTREFAATVKAARPEAIVSFHSHPKAGSEEVYDATLTEVYTPQPWVHTTWRCGELAGYSSVFSVPVLFNVYPHEHFTAAEAQFKALQGLAGGAYPNFWSTPGMQPVFSFMARSAEYLDFASTEPVRFLALPRDLHLDDTHRQAPVFLGVNYGSRDRFLAPYVGAYSALMRAGLPVVTLHRPHFEEQLDRFEVLYLANTALMSQTQAEAVRRFVAAGGGLVATHETSLYDEKGHRRADFALADVMGVHFQSVLPAANRHLRLKPAHQLTLPLAGLPPLSHDEPHVLVRPADAEPVAWLSGAGSEDCPAVLVHQYGRGRVVYLPGRFDSAQCYELSPATERLLASAVRYVAPSGLPIEVEAPGTIGVSLFQQPQHLLVHLLNYQRDSRFRSDDYSPIEPVNLRLRLPGQVHPNAVRRLWREQNLPFEVHDSQLVVKVGRLDEYELITVNWSEQTRK